MRYYESYHSMCHKVNNYPTLFIQKMPGMKTFNINTNHSDVALLVCIVNQVRDMDPEIRHANNFVAKITSNK